MTCVYAITKTTHHPFFIRLPARVIYDHGRITLNGLYLTKLLDSISLPFLLVEERKTIARIPAAFKHCHAMNRPEVVIFTEAVLLGEA
jgi:hypothetical protein